MSLDGIPKILYKYRSFQEDVKKTKRYQRKALVDGELYFTDHERLNDPFDMKIRKKFELLPDDDKLLNIAYHLAKRNGDLSFSSLWEKAKLQHENNLADDKNIYKKRCIEEVQMYLDEIERGIFCLCEKNDDILMWSHYGNSNTGFCMGYNTEKLLNRLVANKIDLLGVFRVKYFVEYPELKLYVGKSKENIEIRLASKSINWLYEGEWRIITHNLTNFVISLLPDEKEIVEEIILGSKILPKTEQKILEIQKQKYPNAKVFKVEPDDSEFKLNVKLYEV